MNAILESLLVPEGATYTYFHRRLADGIPFNWHYHREFELTLTLNSEGQRYVGDSIEAYGDNDLALMGANLPHAWMSQRSLNPAQPHVAHVFWIRADWLDALLATLIELRPVRAVLNGSARGMIFSPGTSLKVRGLVAHMDEMSPTARLARLIDILGLLAEDSQARLLCAPRAEASMLSASDRPRVERALDYIHKHYESTDISMSQLADLAALSVSGLHRLFKRHTRQTVGEYISQLKIGKACSLLVSTSKPVSRIAEDVGYGNLSHFNRQFLAIKGITPREFRRSFTRPEGDAAEAVAPEVEASGRRPRNGTGLSAIVNSY